MDAVTPLCPRSCQSRDNGGDQAGGGVDSSGRCDGTGGHHQPQGALGAALGFVAPATAQTAVGKRRTCVTTSRARRNSATRRSGMPWRCSTSTTAVRTPPCASWRADEEQTRAAQGKRYGFLRGAWSSEPLPSRALWGRAARTGEVDATELIAGANALKAAKESAEFLKTALIVASVRPSTGTPKPHASFGARLSYSGAGAPLRRK